MDTYLNAGKEPPLFHYRGKKEIDLLLHQDGILSPIEIKKAASPGKSAIKHFPVLEAVAKGEMVGNGEGCVICMANDLPPHRWEELVCAGMACVIQRRRPNQRILFL